MWLFDTARYGRLFAGAAVLLSLLACERSRPRTIEQVVAAAKAIPAADSPATKPVPLVPAEPTLSDAMSGKTGLSVPEATDRTGPDTLATWQWTTAQWDSLNANWNKWKDSYSTTRFGRFYLVEGDETPRLFYKVAAHDSTWTEIDLALPHDDMQWNMESRGIELDTVNLDERGTAELVLRFRPAAYGSGGGTEWDHVSVLDVSATPLLLFRALLAAEDEAFGGYATMHGFKIAPGEQYTGCKRSFEVRRHELVLGPVRTIGNTKIGDCTLTKLLAGRYRYQNGKVSRIRK